MQFTWKLHSVDFFLRGLAIFDWLSTWIQLCSLYDVGLTLHVFVSRFKVFQGNLLLCQKSYRSPSMFTKFLFKCVHLPVMYPWCNSRHNDVILYNFMLSGQFESLWCTKRWVCKLATSNPWWKSCQDLSKILNMILTKIFSYFLITILTRLLQKLTRSLKKSYARS